MRRRAYEPRRVPDWHRTIDDSHTGHVSKATTAAQVVEAGDAQHAEAFDYLNRVPPGDVLRGDSLDGLTT